MKLSCLVGQKQNETLDWLILTLAGGLCTQPLDWLIFTPAGGLCTQVNTIYSFLKASAVTLTYSIQQGDSDWSSRSHSQFINSDKRGNKRISIFIPHFSY